MSRVSQTKLLTTGTPATIPKHPKKADNFFLITFRCRGNIQVLYSIKMSTSIGPNIAKSVVLHFSGRGGADALEARDGTFETAPQMDVSFKGSLRSRFSSARLRDHETDFATSTCYCLDHSS